MLVLSEADKTVQSAKCKVQSHLESGEALEKFRENIECQNGDAKVCDDPESLFDKNLY